MNKVPFLDKRLSIARLDDVGLGVLANERINSGTFVEIAPVIVCETNAIATDQEAFKYVMAWESRLAIPLGWTMIYNHSDDNNCEFSTNIQDRLLAIITKRDIVQGEQLTVNYGTHWFSSRGIEKKAM